MSGSEFIGFLGEPVSQVVSDLVGLILIEPVLDHKLGEVAAIDPTGDIVPGRDRGEGAGVVIEPDGVAEAGRLRRQLAEAAYPFRRVVEAPGRAEMQAGIVAGKRRELAAVG